MEIEIFNDSAQGRCVLTDETPDGRSTLRATGVPGASDRDYSPSEILSNEDALEHPVYAAGVVYEWACTGGHSNEDLEAARNYLRQWPDGPQAERDDYNPNHEYHEAMMQVADDISEHSSSLDSLSPLELCAAIHRLVERLADFSTDSAQAVHFRHRIAAAATLISAECQRNRPT